MSFGTALHVMLALAYNDGKTLNSGLLAESIGANAVTVRKVIGQLAQAGLVDTQPGPKGGAQLAKSPKSITVDDVFDAVGRPAFVRGHDKAPNMQCDVSRCMPNVIERLNDALEDKASTLFRRTTLHHLVQEEIQ